MRSGWKLIITSVVLLFLYWAARPKVEVQAVSQAIAADEATPAGHGSNATPHAGTPVVRRDSSIPADPPPTDPSLLFTDSQKRFLCDLARAVPALPLDLELRFWTGEIRETGGSFAWVQSPQCPPGYYSIYNLNADGSLRDAVDCRNTDLTTLALNSGFQASIEDASDTDERLNMAIAGPGYFLLDCGGRESRLTRDGKFYRGPQNRLVDEEGCSVLSAEQEPMRFDSDSFDKYGCLASGECLAIIDPAEISIGPMEYLNSYSFRFDGGNLDVQTVLMSTLANRFKLFPASLEDIHNPKRGLTSVDWSDSTPLRLKDLDCLKNLP
jgi:hypothetical protein